MKPRQAKKVLGDGRLATRHVGARRGALDAALRAAVKSGEPAASCAVQAKIALSDVDRNSKVGDHPGLAEALRAVAGALQDM